MTEMDIDPFWYTLAAIIIVMIWQRVTERKLFALRKDFYALIDAMVASSILLPISAVDKADEE